MASGFSRLFGKPSKPSKSSKSSKSSKKKDEDRSDYIRNKEIEKRLYEDKKKADKEVKIILLGAGESGKSTIVKQMRIIHHGGFDDNERRVWKNHIFQNVIEAFVEIFDIMKSQNTHLEGEENRHYVHMLFTRRNIAPFEDFPMDYYDCFSDLWADEGVQLALLKGNECALHDNLIYFIEGMDRLFQPDYLPTDQDILRTRLRTTGIHETIFEIGQHTYRMVDVGGQRSERKKWIHAFDNVNAILFIAAISGYDQGLVEDRDGNQMEEALHIFDEIANMFFFKHTHIILFLNKFDLFQEKILTGISRISTYYPDYKGDAFDVQAGQKFFFDKFRRRYRRTAEGEMKKELYVHYTNATDTNLLKKTMDLVQNSILRSNVTRDLL